jgi:hypothetical protein
MSAPTVIEVIDAIATDIEAIVGLPAHALHKYAEPRAYRLDVKPALGVWLSKIAADVVSTTHDYYDAYQVKILWASNIFRASETNDGEVDATLVSAALTVVESIIARVRPYAEAVPGLVNTTAVLTSVEFDPAEKQMGWECLISLDVEVFA